jgi:DNA-binding TFAR19-related protein (PDSD5 family)
MEGFRGAGVMATKRSSRKTKHPRSKQSQAGASPASNGLVVRAIKNDPAGKEQIISLVQQLGELRFGVKYIEELEGEQQRSWIRFNHSVNQAHGDYAGLVRLIEQVIEEERDADLRLVEAKIRALKKKSKAEARRAAKNQQRKEEQEDAEEKRKDALLQSNLQDQATWRNNQQTLVRLTVFCVLFTSAMIVLGAVSEKATFLGGSGIGAGIAIALVRAILSSEMNPFLAPRQSVNPRNGLVPQEPQ